MSNSNTCLNYAVTLHTLDTDDHGVPWERITSVQWDEGVVQDWDDWLTHYNELEEETYMIQEISPLVIRTPDEEEEIERNLWPAFCFK